MSEIFKEESDYLKYVKECLEKNIEYEKNQMIEIPKKYTNVLQGDSFLVESLMSMAATRLYQLENAKNNPYFGRIDFLGDDTNQLAKLYIGKVSITADSVEQATIDWRTPICSLYYNSDIGKVSYEAPKGTITGELKLKRQIIIENGNLIDFRDNGIVAQDSLLEHYLKTHANDKMKNIIASIQKEQYEIIQMPLNINAIIQGVAGSGKTSVALHRIAYLIYNEKDKITNKQFLVIGPNKYFLDYISNLLPDLEVSNVSQTTFSAIALDVIGEKINIIDQNVAIENSFQDKLRRDELSIKSSLKFENALEQFLKDYIEENIFQDIKYNECTILGSNEIKNFFENSNFLNIMEKIKKIQELRIKSIKNNPDEILTKLTEKEGLKNIPFGDPRRKDVLKRISEIEQEVKSGCSKVIKNHFKSAVKNTIQIYKTFIENLDKYITDVDVSEMQQYTLKNLSKKNVEYEDLPALMTIKMAFNGDEKYKDYKQVVLDEAQDLGIYHFDILKKIFKDAYFTLYGDLNQAIYKYRSINDWNEIKEQIFNGNCIIKELKQSYRTTNEIMQEANAIPKNLGLTQAETVIRHGETVNYILIGEKDVLNQIKRLIENYINKNYQTIGIISKSFYDSKNICEKLNANGIKAYCINDSDEKYYGGICCVASYLSKGLEFDATILTNVSEDNYRFDSDIEQHLLYVAMTRALHEVSILYDKSLSKILDKNNKVRKLSK